MGCRAVTRYPTPYTAGGKPQIKSFPAAIVLLVARYMRTSAPGTYPGFDCYVLVGSKTRFAPLVSFLPLQYFGEVVISADINSVSLVVEICSFGNLRKFCYCVRLLAKF